MGGWKNKEASRMSYNGTRRQVGAKLKLSAANRQSDTGVACTQLL